jgi:hypothetical protein
MTKIFSAVFSEADIVQLLVTPKFEKPIGVFKQRLNDSRKATSLESYFSPKPRVAAIV